ncbi:MAG TPA: hypothetical protein VI728_02700, partial [Syntrophales bacterium]|nr:hypothetical protein [Syntrophales bacterium]
MNYDGFVKNLFSLPWREGIKGRGKITFRNTATYHPHPNPPPSRERRFRTFYEVVIFDELVKSRFSLPWWE